MKISRLHWLVFNFGVRRVAAPAFVLVGVVVGLGNIRALLPGSSSSDDLLLRIVGVAFPLLVAALGVALFRAKPFVPPGSKGERDDPQ